MNERESLLSPPKKLLMIGNCRRVFGKATLKKTALWDVGNKCRQ